MIFWVMMSMTFKWFRRYFSHGVFRLSHTKSQRWVFDLLVLKIETNKKRKKKAETGEFSPKNVLKTYSNMTVLQYKTSYLFLAQNKQQQVGNK